MHTFGDVVIVQTRRLKRNISHVHAPESVKEIMIGLRGRKFVVIGQSQFYGYWLVDMAGHKRHMPHQVLKRIRKANPDHVAKLKKALEA